MSLFTKVGEAAVQASVDNGGGSDSPIVSFKTGTTLKVGVKSVNDVAEYYGYGLYKKGGGGVQTFVPKQQSQRNAKGFVTGNPTVWDRAAEALYADAKAAEESGAAEADVKSIRETAGLFRGKQRFLRAFYDLTTGKDIVVDLSPHQERVVKAAIEENVDDLDVIPFKLAKKGEGKNAVVSLSPIVKVDRDLTDEERANFAKISEAPFDLQSFETCLYVADEAEQTKNLVIAGFDIARLGLSIGAAAISGSSGVPADESVPISGDAPASELPF